MDDGSSEIPDVIGWEAEQAKDRLRECGILDVVVVPTAPPQRRASGTHRVLAQTSEDQRVTLIVAREMTREDAKRPKRTERDRT